MTTDLILRTPRLLLRPLQEGDAAALWPFVSNPDLPRLMTWDAHRDIKETEAFVSAMVEARGADTNLVWAITCDGVLAGLVGLHEITRTVRAWRVDRAELGYWLGPTYQNRGLVSEAATAVVRFAFQDLALHKVTVGCIVDNAPSRRVIEKLGFRLIGEQRDHMFRFGRWWNHLAYELCVDEWRDT